MKTDLQKVLSISGYPGLFTLVSQGRNGVIVESLVSKKRMNASGNTRITELADVAIYTDDDDVALKDVLRKIKEIYNGAPAVNHKSDEATLREFMTSVLPNYDRSRVYISHIKKIAEWYNLLQAYDMLDFEDVEKENDAKENKE
ncbi:MAG: DUF5606 domain-containing protein [Prevotellaceae bacterium]|jgi:hypothetical protein|nr:DUF5606 domain-containing protein [Prevotellaceae bacterium]